MKETAHSHKPMNGGEQYCHDRLVAQGIPASEIIREFLFASEDLGRDWRADFYIPKLRCLLEVEGGIYRGFQGRHTNPLGFSNDMEKYNCASLLGYTLVRTSSAHAAIDKVTRVLAELWHNDGKVTPDFIDVLADCYKRKPKPKRQGKLVEA